MSDILGTVRASSWGDLADCAYRWYWKNIEGVRSPTRGAMVVGTAVHKGTDVFDRPRLTGQSGSVNDAVDIAADFVRSPTDQKGAPDEVDWTDEDEKLDKAKAVDIAVGLTAKYCQEVAPTMKYEAIEVLCTKLDVGTEHGVLRMTGTTDRVRIYDDGVRGISDFKSGGKAVEGITSGKPRAVTKGHGLQLGAYTLMTEAELKEKMGRASIIGFQTNSKLHIADGVVEHPTHALVGTGKLPGIITIAAGMLKSGLFPPNPKSMLCSKRWCPAWDLCIYHD